MILYLKQTKIKFLTFGCFRFIDSNRFLSSSLDKLVKTMQNIYFKILKNHFPDIWMFKKKKLAYPYENFNSLDAYHKPVDNLKKKYFFSEWKNNHLDDEEIERTRKTIELFDNKNEEELTQL